MWGLVVLGKASSFIAPAKKNAATSGRISVRNHRVSNQHLASDNPKVCVTELSVDSGANLLGRCSSMTKVLPSLARQNAGVTVMTSITPNADTSGTIENVRSVSLAANARSEGFRSSEFSGTVAHLSCIHGFVRLRPLTEGSVTSIPGTVHSDPSARHDMQNVGEAM